MKFKVESVLTLDEIPIVVACKLTAGDFSSSASSRLERVSIPPVVTQPHKLLSDGNPELEIFAFTLANQEDVASFMVGKLINLQT